MSATKLLVKVHDDSEVDLLLLCYVIKTVTAVSCVISLQTTNSVILLFFDLLQVTLKRKLMLLYQKVLFLFKLI